MTKFVILGSRRFSPYRVIFTPLEMPDVLDEEERFQISIKKSHPAIDEADAIIVYAPDGIGEHTQRDIDYALKNCKEVFELVPLKVKVKKETISIWVSERHDEAEILFKRFRDLGFTVCTASFPGMREPILWYRDEVYEGEDRIDHFEKKIMKRDEEE